MASFNKRVKQIANAEKDVDKVLKAARLRRNPVNSNDLETILEYAVYLTVIVGIFGMFALMIILA